MVNDIVIWAHSECRSVMTLFGEVKRQAKMPVTIALWKYGEEDYVRKRREMDGQRREQYKKLSLVAVGENLKQGRKLLYSHSGEGCVHVFCVYQVSRVWRRLMLEAKSMGLRVVVYAEAPCEMCIGWKAGLKRIYYYWCLPWLVGNVAASADLFLSQSGRAGMDRLVRLGWNRQKIVPFGYVSDVENLTMLTKSSAVYGRGFLRILHTGVEDVYRGVDVLRTAVTILKDMGVSLEVRCTGGKCTQGRMNELYAWADVFVACGLCEPWGMRVNDAIHSGLPVVVSNGMGVEWMVENYGCGSVFASGDSKSLADILFKFATDARYVAQILLGVQTAHKAWLPTVKAKDFLAAISGEHVR